MTKMECINFEERFKMINLSMSICILKQMITVEFKAVSKFKDTYLPSAPVALCHNRCRRQSKNGNKNSHPIYRNPQELVGPDGCFVIKQKGPKADLTTSQRSCYALPLPREQNVEKEDLDYCRSFIARQNVIPVVLGRQGYVPLFIRSS